MTFHRESQEVKTVTAGIAKPLHYQAAEENKLGMGDGAAECSRGCGQGLQKTLDIYIDKYQFYIYLWVSVLPACVSVCHMHAEARRGRSIPWNQS